jgi:hypothetical protein
MFFQMRHRICRDIQVDGKAITEETCQLAERTFSIMFAGSFSFSAVINLYCAWAAWSFSQWLSKEMVQHLKLGFVRLEEAEESVLPTYEDAVDQCVEEEKCPLKA